MKNSDNNKELGWISIHRKIREHWIWNDPVKLKWWIDLLMEANHQDNKINIGYEVFECKRGQTIRSLQGWAYRWNVSRDTARNFLKMLHSENMILTKNLKKTTQITICNYDTYQTSLHDEQTRGKREANDFQTQGDTNNNVNNDNNEDNEKKYIYDFENFWNDYGRKFNKEACINLWKKLSEEDKIKIRRTLPGFKQQFSSVLFLPHPKKYLIEKNWQDEINTNVKFLNGKPFDNTPTLKRF